MYEIKSSQYIEISDDAPGNINNNVQYFIVIIYCKCMRKIIYIAKFKPVIALHGSVY
jgi:hypothetical protein